jgi:nitrogen regulatory protein P-II 1
MKKLEAVIQPYLLDDVKQALDKLGIDGMTVSDVRGHGRHNGHRQVYRGQEYTVDVLPQIKIEVVVSDDQVEELVTTVSAAVRSGIIGDGMIFISDLSDVVRIRTGHRGELAI